MADTEFQSDLLYWSTGLLHHRDRTLLILRRVLTWTSHNDSSLTNNGQDQEWCTPGLVELDYWILVLFEDRSLLWEDGDIRRSSGGKC